MFFSVVHLLRTAADNTCGLLPYLKTQLLVVFHSIRHDFETEDSLRPVDQVENAFFKV